MSHTEFSHHRVTVHTELILHSGTGIEWHSQLELSVDDPVEQRVDRTVVLDEDPEKSSNRSSKGHYPGFVLGFSAGWQAGVARGQRRSTSEYLCQLPFASFTDAQEQVESSRRVSWGRVRYQLRCAACETSSHFSSQTNQQFPRELVCACGAVLGKEERSNPVIQPAVALGK